MRHYYLKIFHVRPHSALAGIVDAEARRAVVWLRAFPEAGYAVASASHPYYLQSLGTALILVGRDWPYRVKRRGRRTARAAFMLAESIGRSV